MPYLDVAGGHRLYFEQHGTGPRAALWLHGGPGSGLDPAQSRLFDLDRFSVMLLDQRGAGRSSPAATGLDGLAHNTTAHLIAAYDQALRGPDAQAAADAWATWELATFDRHWRDDPNSRWADTRFRLRFARTCAQYFANGCFLAPNQIASDLSKIARIPCHMVHSRFDPSAPLRTPWELAQAWPAAQL